MRGIHRPDPCPQLSARLAIDCKNCQGLCCAALAFSRCDGFPADKAAGEPCRYLGGDFRCAVHARLGQKGLHGCMAFDCFGAGQRVSGYYPGRDWRSAPALKDALFARFLAVYRLHQMLWLLGETLSLLPAHSLWEEAAALIAEGDELARQPSPGLGEYHRRVSRVLQSAGALVCREAGPAAPGRKRMDYAGRSLRGQSLCGRDMSMALLIAADLRDCNLYGANLCGADLRDCDLRGADLHEACFLTQGQLAAAKGDKTTRLPPRLRRPAGWEG